MTKDVLIERLFQGFGLVMTVALFLFLRFILRQVRSEKGAERTEEPADRESGSDPRAP